MFSRPATVSGHTDCPRIGRSVPLSSIAGKADAWICAMIRRHGTEPCHQPPAGILLTGLLARVSSCFPCAADTTHSPPLLYPFCCHLPTGRRAPQKSRTRTEQSERPQRRRQPHRPSTALGRAATSLWRRPAPPQRPGAQRDQLGGGNEDSDSAEGGGSGGGGRSGARGRGRGGGGGRDYTSGGGGDAKRNHRRKDVNKAAVANHHRKDRQKKGMF